MDPTLTAACEVGKVQKKTEGFLGFLRFFENYLLVLCFFSVFVACWFRCCAIDGRWVLAWRDARGRRSSREITGYFGIF